jgi:dinuclear metal center YbgI/SA1388 family protein
MPGSIRRDDLAAYLEVFLDAARDRDYGPNGLQVEGRDEIRRVVTAVSACEELSQRAKELEADAILVHHGLYWDGTPALLKGLMLRRVRPLIEGEISLFAYHLPLDRHAGLGNNILAARAFGLEEIVPFAQHRGLEIGFRGNFRQPISIGELALRCAEIYGQEPLVLGPGQEGRRVRSLGIVSGGAQRDFYAAIDAGCDAYITGEVSEWVTNVAREAGVHYLAAGHYATERLGIRALGEHLAEKLGIEAIFVDLPNPV